MHADKPRKLKTKPVELKNLSGQLYQLMRHEILKLHRGIFKILIRNESARQFQKPKRNCNAQHMFQGTAHEMYQFYSTTAAKTNRKPNRLTFQSANVSRNVIRFQALPPGSPDTK